MASGFWERIPGQKIWVRSTTNGAILSRLRMPPCRLRARRPIPRSTPRTSLRLPLNTPSPTFGRAESGWKKALFGGCTTAGILRYSSGTLIQVPNAQNGLTSVTFASNNFSNCVPNQSLFLHSLNKHDFNPRTTFVLNSAAWSDPAIGRYGTSKPRYSDFRNADIPTSNWESVRCFR